VETIVVHPIAVLLAVLVGLVFGLLAWGLLRMRSYDAGDVSIEVRDSVLVGLLILAAFALGAFISYMIIAVG
jgi:hypothetical protein